MAVRLSGRRTDDLRPGDGSGGDAARLEPVRIIVDRFAAIYDRHFDDIYRYCYRQLGDELRAEDAAQQVFANALAAFAHYHEDGRLRPWLFAIAHNVIDNDRRRTRPTAPLADTDDLADRGASLEEQVIAEEDRRFLREAVGRLPVDQRRATELRVQGMTGKQIADEMGRSHEAVKKLLGRAVDRLSDELGGAHQQRKGIGRGH